MNTDTATWPLLSEHSGPFLRLQRTLRGRDGFTLCVLVYSDTPYRTRVAEFLMERLDATVQITVNREWHDGIDPLLTRLARVASPVQVVGLDLWSAGPEDLLARLNQRRESIAELFPHPLLVWVRSNDVHALATRAADLWAWRTGVFDFALPPETHRSSVHRYQTDAVAMDATERQERAQAIRAYLADRHVLRPIDAELLLELGDLQRWAGDIESAHKAYREAEEALAQTDDRRRHAIARGRIADLLAMRGHLDKELKIRKEEELPVYQELGDMRLYALTKGEIAATLTLQGDLPTALRIRREEELPVYERLGLDRLAIVTKGQIADLLSEQGQVEEALRIRQEEVLPWFEQAGDVHSRAVTLGRIADVHMAQGRLDEALCIRREEELPVYARLGDRRSYAATQGQVAEILISRGELDEALSILRRKALPVFEEMDDLVGLAFTYDKIANAYQGQQRLDDALQIRRDKELPIYDKLGKVEAKAVTQGQIARILDRLGRLEDALRIHIDHQIPLLKELDDQHSLAATRTLAAHLMMKQGRIDAALGIIDREVLPASSFLDNHTVLVPTYMLVADILRTGERFDQALKVHAEKVIPLCDRLGDEHSRAKSLFSVAQIMADLGRVEEALRVLRDQVAPIFEALDDAELRTKTSQEIDKLSGGDHYSGSRHSLPGGSRVRVVRSDGTRLDPDRAIAALKWGGPGVFDFGGHHDGSKLLGAALLLDGGVDFHIVRRVHERFADDVIAELADEWTLRVSDIRTWLDELGSSSGSGQSSPAPLTPPR